MKSVVQLKDLGRAWAAAELAGDTVFLDRTLTDDFIAVGTRGGLMNKEEWLARHTSGDTTYHSVTWDDVTVRVYGDAAIVTGRETAHISFKDQDVSGQFRVSLIFTAQNDTWRMAGLHLSAMPDAS